ncbi:AlbA family DNA-binding domain-containing protein [Terracidiphilus gabretensis]|uniref:AlbA family DNA-binding domain-containing protein n=1 Tax=Terracidiphilus gabretensis TaxID=1577687 RepID=UPI00071B0FB2|nr:ATP-binding protein [Terracidiphilus gabretensis]
MAKRLTVDEVLYFLGRGDFDEIIDAVEDEYLEFKGAPYHLASDSMKLELAKDVSALANGDGGLIVLGFCTSKDPDSFVEFVHECRPFDRKLSDLDQYVKVLADWICPAMSSVELLPFSSRANIEKIVVALFVPAREIDQKPFLVNRAVDPAGKVRGTQFGYYERIRGSYSGCICGDIEILHSGRDALL